MKPNITYFEPYNSGVRLWNTLKVRSSSLGGLISSTFLRWHGFQYFPPPYSSIYGSFRIQSFLHSFLESLNTAVLVNRTHALQPWHQPPSYSKNSACRAGKYDEEPFQLSLVFCVVEGEFLDLVKA